MLQLKQITKDYPAGSGVVHALRGVDLSFRSSEFVSILGPSGCGKTTLLNIMGGLDQYTSGDLVIGGRSTKHFKDRDWDTYRNHSVGFVFQSYNLIPHQSVLQNVELALSLSGVPKAERRRRAAQALQQVGLGGELRKKPGQMSGGQMQRVAIARALVNDPEIILADEPTGALDTETSVQVMDILKEISKERLVIMVTHNPDLAAKYSTRIIRMLDGRITDDSAPLTEAELAAEQHRQEMQQQGRQKKPSLSFTTSFALSLKNLISKRGRTLLTAFAGSIGIIGIALIYAVSQGMTDYIDAVQEDTLSTYPLVITSETADMTAMLTAFGSVLADDENQPPNTVREQQLMSQVFAQIGTNDLTAFREHLEASMDTVGEDINALRYSYNVTPQIYSRDFSHGVVQVNPGQLFSSAMLGSSMGMMNTEVLQEM
ncbi:MAG: ABC transporter ATP-binding protein, partial [Oscillospiraceae bacterium]|nr:ABC transporter ATP-binding protein [Oscillospiraceae bacterium]